MTLKKTICFGFGFLLVATLFSSTSHAQQRIHKTLRWLGHGVGDGYNVCQPMIDSDYYSPYSSINSTLISQSPEYQASLSGKSLNGQRFHQGVPFSVYATPVKANSSASFPVDGGKTLDNSLEPYVPAPVSEEASQSVIPKNAASLLGPDFIDAPLPTPVVKTPTQGMSKAAFPNNNNETGKNDFQLNNSETNELYDPFEDE